MELLDEMLKFVVSRDALRRHASFNQEQLFASILQMASEELRTITDTATQVPLSKVMNAVAKLAVSQKGINGCIQTFLEVNRVKEVKPTFKSMVESSRNMSFSRTSTLRQTSMT